LKVKFELSAEETLAYIMRDNKELGYKILKRLEILKYEPYPHFFGNYIFNSETVKFLKKQGYDIRKLWCSEFDTYRIFYFVDDKKELVIICEIIKRQDDNITYGDYSPHIKRIKEAYKKHFNI